MSSNWQTSGTGTCPPVSIETGLEVSCTKGKGKFLLNSIFINPYLINWHGVSFHMRISINELELKYELIFT